jgi:hypothetical protein
MLLQSRCYSKIHMLTCFVKLQLIRRFDLSVVNPVKPWQSINVGVFLQSEYWIRGYRRMN